MSERRQSMLLPSNIYNMHQRAVSSESYGYEHVAPTPALSQIPFDEWTDFGIYDSPMTSNSSPSPSEYPATPQFTGVAPAPMEDILSQMSSDQKDDLMNEKSCVDIMAQVAAQDHKDWAVVPNIWINNVQGDMQGGAMRRYTYPDAGPLMAYSAHVGNASHIQAAPTSISVSSLGAPIEDIWRPTAESSDLPGPSTSAQPTTCIRSRRSRSSPHLSRGRWTPSALCYSHSGGSTSLHFQCTFRRTRDHRGMFCQQTFNRIEHLRRHIKTVHSPHRPFSCIVCGTLFSRGDNLRDHYWTHVSRSGRIGKNTKMSLEELETILGPSEEKLIGKLREKRDRHMAREPRQLRRGSKL